jgi:thiol-disulfide isomerase/thioredoxin
MEVFNTIIRFKKAGTAIAVMLLISFSCHAQRQNVNRLFIGDKAPEFKYGTWLKGSPVKEYKKDHLYIFEFWATWCGPCIVSMPHLSEFAKANVKNVTVIAVNIWEDKSGKVAYETLWPKVTRFVKGMGDKMDFNVVTDTKDQHMGTNWMTAAGQGGIPCSFILKNGVIQWIGHPVQIDSIVKVVSDPKYDVAAVRERAMVRANRVPSAEEKAAAELRKKIDSAIENKQYAEAIKLMDKSVAGLSPQMAGPTNFNKFTTLLNYVSEAEAMAFVRDWQATNPGFKGSVGAVIANTPKLSRDTYLYGINILKELVDNPQPGHLMYNFIAVAYANMGDYKGAVEAQEKAIAIGKQYLKDGKFVGFVLPDTITEYEAKLVTYKSKVK